MVSSRYKSGTRYEYKLVNFFRERGYVASRSAGSHGIWDVIAVNKNEVILAQVKHSNNKNYKPRKEEIEKIKTLEVPKNVKKWLVVFKPMMEITVID